MVCSRNVMEELICNISKCGAKLTSTAWATSCFHIFCNDCAVKEFSETSFCPLCKVKFVDKLDVKCVDVQPSERSKAMMMVGLKPETIMEVCQRGLSFWSYQIAHQINGLENYANSLKEQKNHLEQLYKHLISRAETTVTGLRQQNEGLKKELDILRQKNAEFNDKLMEKNRYIHKLQNMYEASRRRVISSKPFEEKDSGFIPKFVNMSNTNHEQHRGRNFLGCEEPLKPWKIPEELAVNMSSCCLNENAVVKNLDCSNPKLF